MFSCLSSNDSKNKNSTFSYLRLNVEMKVYKRIMSHNQFTGIENRPLFEKLKVLTVSMGPPWKSPHSKFLGVGSSSNSRSMSAPSPNTANRSVNPSLPDDTEGAYATDEFRMYSCKVEKCPYDGHRKWSQCPYTHTGDENFGGETQRSTYTNTSGVTISPTGVVNKETDVEKLMESMRKGSTRELRMPSSSLSAYTRYAAGTSMGFEPAPCPVPDSPSISVALPMRPSTIEISNNAPSLSADSRRPETSFSSNIEDGFPGKIYRTYYGPFSPILTSTDRSRNQKQSMLSPSRTLDDETWFGPTPDLSWVDALLDEPEDQFSLFPTGATSKSPSKGAKSKRQNY